MESTLVLNRSESLVHERKRTIRNVTKTTSERSITERSPWNLASEGGEYFMKYISRFVSDHDPNVLVLSSKHHYYYDIDELKGISTLINLKRLNFMNHLESYLHVVSKNLSPNAIFVGCFADKKSQKQIGISSRLYKKLINFLDYRIDIDIDREKLKKLFEASGFRIMDMTEINGLTYFTSSKCSN
jgi:hypothetical protein